MGDSIRMSVLFLMLVSWDLRPVGSWVRSTTKTFVFGIVINSSSKATIGLASLSTIHNKVSEIADDMAKHRSNTKN